MSLYDCMIYFCAVCTDLCTVCWPKMHIRCTHSWKQPLASCFTMKHPFQLLKVCLPKVVIDARTSMHLSTTGPLCRWWRGLRGVCYKESL